MLILQTLQWGPQHGYGISQAMRVNSGEVLDVDTGSLYPALHRLERQGWVKAALEDVGQQPACARVPADAEGQAAALVGTLPMGADPGGHRRHPSQGRSVSRRRTFTGELTMWRFSRRREAELDEEVRTHLAMAERDRIDRGESPDVARAAARREFGNLGLIKEITREIWGWQSVERLVQDLRYAARSLRRSPAFTVTAILTMTIGIGLNTAMFTAFNAVGLRGWPAENADTLVLIKSEGAGCCHTVRLRSRRSAALPAAEPQPRGRRGEPVRVSFRLHRSGRDRPKCLRAIRHARVLRCHGRADGDGPQLPPR